MNKQTPWRQYLCRACGYIYDEKLGDPDGGLPAGTRFEDIPDDWQCPLCGVRKQDFELIEPNDVCLSSEFVGMHTQKGVVIIGAGLAGWSVVDAIRALDKQIAITLISADSGCRYHKPMLSAAISQHKTPDDLIRITGAQAAAAADINLIANTFVVDIDSQSKTIYTTRGNLGYDKLVLAIGANPAYPTTIAKQHAWHVNHLTAYGGFLARLDKPKHIAIIGAGMIGVEMAEDLLRAGHKVSLLDIHPYPLAQLMPKLAADKVTSSLTALGVQFFAATMVQNVHKTKDGYTLTLQDCTDNHTQSLMVDEILVATGLVVDERLPTRAGVDFSRHAGIVVDETTLATSVADIYAIGDCIAIAGRPCRFVAPHRTQAAAIAHAVTNTPFEGYKHTAPMIRLKNKAVSVQATGSPTGGGDWQVVSDDGVKLVMEQTANDAIVATLTVTQAKQ